MFLTLHRENKLMKRSFQLHQGNQSLIEYYNELNSVFMELDYYWHNDMSFTANIEKLKKSTTEDRVYIFLACLD